MQPSSRNQLPFVHHSPLKERKNSYSSTPLSSKAAWMQVRPSWFEDALLSVLLLLLVLEWLYPIERLSEITELYSIRPFAVTFAFLVWLDTLRRNVWGVWLLKACWIVGFTVWLHHGQSVPSAEEWAVWARELVIDANEGLHGQLDAWEPSTRTLLFTAGWAFFISVVQAIVLERRQVHWFVLMTLVFSSLLQIAFGLDAFVSICRCMFFGLLLQLLLQGGGLHRWMLDRDSKADKPPAASRTNAAWLSGVSILCLVLLAGGLSALSHPQQGKPPESLRFIEAWQDRFQSLVKPVQEAAAARTGYGLDDSRIGRPLQQDERIAFHAVTDRLTYWRGEAKTVYTGQGWTEPDQPGALSRISDPKANVETSEGFTTVRQSITLADSTLNRILFTGGALTRIISLQSAQGNSIPTEWVWKHSATDRIMLPSMTEPLLSYTLESRILTDRSLLQHASEIQVPEDLQKQFTQLPDGIPDRVGALARQITQNASGSLAKAEAIERYLRENYRYDTVNTRGVEAGEDLVDHFLFEQLSGYCDHFSTAMVVLLREVGVPVRWVKGFAPGEVIDEWMDAGKTLYSVQVKQKDAHAWVEVYSSDYGWVSYEPTPGFAGTAGQAAAANSFTSLQTEMNKNTVAPASLPQWYRPVLKWLDSVKHDLENIINKLSDVSAFLDRTILSLRDGLRLMVQQRPYFFEAFLVLLAGGWIFAIIRLWIGRLRKQRTRLKTGKIPLQQHMDPRGKGLFYGLRRMAAHRSGERVWRKVQRRFGKASPSQTLREYAMTRSLRSNSQAEALCRLTGLLEMQRYADPYSEQGSVTRQTLQDAWRELLHSS